MKRIIFYTIVLALLSGISYAASSGDGDNSSKKTLTKFEQLQKKGTSLVKKGKKFEKKNKIEKAKKNYVKAFEIFEEANKLEKNNPDVLNYLGFTSRKIGNLKEAETYYLKGLKLDAQHIGINEYLGELYVYTDRIELAKERLEVLRGCECEEYNELKEVIEKKGTIKY